MQVSSKPIMSRRRERVSIFLRISPEAKAWLKRLADRHETSVNAEIVRIVRLRMMADRTVDCEQGA
jgi:hypothetical protein